MLLTALCWFGFVCVLVHNCLLVFTLSLVFSFACTLNFLSTTTATSSTAASPIKVSKPSSSKGEMPSGGTKSQTLPPGSKKPGMCSLLNCRRVRIIRGHVSGYRSLFASQYESYEPACNRFFTDVCTDTVSTCRAPTSLSRSVRHPSLTYKHYACGGVRRVSHCQWPFSRRRVSRTSNISSVSRVRWGVMETKRFSETRRETWWWLCCTTLLAVLFCIIIGLQILHLPSDL